MQAFENSAETEASLVPSASRRASGQSAIRLSSDEAWALLDMCLVSPQPLDCHGESALLKLASYVISVSHECCPGSDGTLRP